MKNILHKDLFIVHSEFISLSCSILTINDHSSNEDTSGNLLENNLIEAGHKCIYRCLIKSNKYQIRRILSNWIADSTIQVILTIGGTGYHFNDDTYQSVLPLLDEIIEGFGELFRQISYKEIGSSTVQSRAFAGYANNTLIFCLPSSSNACHTAWSKLLCEQLDSSYLPCNFSYRFKNKD
ncbi:MAG: molybdenum cofactor biosynthesis protein [Bordetella sp.]|nr:MAG: molybdenum cofactor biosynthesis protein [Bordetella sp.]